MGLDMYLSAKKYVSNFDFNLQEKELNAKIKELMGLTGFDEDNNSIYVEMGVGYWRKANAIHQWFVDNVQDGDDDCGNYYVPNEQLIELRDLCIKTIESKDASLLPPQEGFFFGSTNIDEWYWKDLQDTIDIINKVLDNDQLKEYDIYYHASW